MTLYFFGYNIYHNGNLPMDNLGICANCALVGQCSFRSSSDKPVWYCNDFILPKDNKSKVSKQEGGLPGIAEKVFRTEEYQGLCAYCGLKNDCMIPLRSGGIWHCNEYI